MERGSAASFLALILLISVGFTCQSPFGHADAVTSATAQAPRTVWTDKTTYAFGENVTITMTYKQMIGTQFAVTLYRPNGSSFKLNFPLNSNFVAATADEAGDWRVELWGRPVVPNSNATLEGTCTFTVIGTQAPVPEFSALTIAAFLTLAASVYMLRRRRE